jgi:hypothetical protein
MSQATQQQAETERPDEPDISHDECFDLLSNHRRRYALRYLQHNGDSATIGELSDQIAAWENGIGTEEVSYDQRKRVYTSLQQVHLPRMDDADVIAYDDRQGVVETGPAAEELDIYLEVVDGGGISWAQLYVGLAVLTAGVIAAGLVGAPFLGSLPGLAWAVFAVTTFGLTGVAHAYYNRSRMHLDDRTEPPSEE